MIAKRERQEYNKKFRETHVEHLKNYERNRSNKAERQERNKIWYLEHRGERKAYNDKYREENIDKLRAYDRERHQKRHAWRIAYFRKLKLEIIREYGGACRCCDEDMPEFMSIDHINEDGAKHRKEEKCGGGTPFYLWLKRNKFPKDNFQLLCFNCNMAKHRYGVCPHQRTLGGEAKA